MHRTPGGAPTAGAGSAARAVAAAQQSLASLQLRFFEAGCSDATLREIFEKEALQANPRSQAILLNNVLREFRMRNCPERHDILLDMLKTQAAGLEEMYLIHKDVVCLSSLASAAAACDMTAGLEEAANDFSIELWDKPDPELASAAAEELAVCKSLRKCVFRLTSSRHPARAFQYTLASRNITSILVSNGLRSDSEQASVVDFLRLKNWRRLGDLSTLDANGRQILGFAAATVNEAALPALLALQRDFKMFEDPSDDADNDISELFADREQMLADAVERLRLTVTIRKTLKLPIHASALTLQASSDLLIPTALCRHKTQLNGSISRLQNLLTQRLLEGSMEQTTALKQNVQRLEGQLGSTVKDLQELGSAVKELQQGLAAQQASTDTRITRVYDDAQKCMEAQAKENALQHENGAAMGRTIQANLQRMEQGLMHVHGMAQQAQAGVAAQGEGLARVRGEQHAQRGKLKAVTTQLTAVKAKQGQQEAAVQAVQMVQAQQTTDIRTLARAEAETRSELRGLKRKQEDDNDEIRQELNMDVGRSTSTRRPHKTCRTPAASPSPMAPHCGITAGSGGSGMVVAFPAPARSPLADANINTAAHGWLCNGGTPTTAAVPRQLVVPGPQAQGLGDFRQSG